jgi:peptide/nickel transport system permease protein
MSVQATQQIVLHDSVTPAYQPRGFPAFARDVFHRSAAAIAAGVIGLIVLLAIFAPLVAPHNPDTINVGDVLAGPSLNHLLGTDSLGRDNFSRLLYGSRVALEVALSSVLIAFLIGSTLGIIAGYLAGFSDKVLVVVFDAIISFPAVILGLALLTLLSPSVRSVVFVIALALVPYYGRLMRAQTLAEKKNQYVKAERALGASRRRVLQRHILPNVLPPLLIVVAMDIPGAIVVEAGLAFLGLGVQPPTPDWGVMLNDGFTYLGTSPWEIVGPIAMLIIITTAFTVLGETMRDVLDPRYRPPRRVFGWRMSKAVD